MDDFGFLRGNEITVKINGNEVGGVISAVCKTENNLIRIKEFLTDKPVFSVEAPKYTIELKTRRSPDEILGGQAVSSVELAGGGKTVEYTSCSVAKTNAAVLPENIVEYSVVISADRRSVEND